VLAVVATGNRLIAVDGTDELYGGVLEAVVVDKETLVEIYFKAHLLLVVLVQKTDIPGQVAFVVNSVQTLAGTQLTHVGFVSCFIGRAANAIVGQGEVAGVAFLILFVFVFFKTGETLETRLCFHLQKKGV